MIKKHLFVVLLAICAILFTGCEIEGYIVDWAPVEIYIHATDANGKSIIKPDMPGMTLTFKGETYTVKDGDNMYEEHMTRAYLATLYGLYAQHCSTSDSTKYMLYFGEIDGAADMDEDIVLKWPDGSTDIIHYHCSDHKESRPPKCNRSWKLNGKKHNGNEFSFTGKSLE